MRRLVVIHTFQRSLSTVVSDYYRATAGGRFKLKLAEEGGSMSVLIPSQEQLVYRSCVEEEYYNLLNWFSWVEQRAWDRVNAYFANERPSRIFLVTGQDA